MNEPIHFMRGHQRFEVRYEPTPPHYSYVGYVDGIRSVTALSADVAARALIKKHIVGLPSAKILYLAPIQHRLKAG